MKKIVYYLSILFVILFFSLTGCKKNEDNPVDTPQDQSTVGELTVTPNGIFVNTFAHVTVHLTVPANVKLKEGSVTLYKLDTQNNNTDSVGSLRDNGELYNGDDIIGDNVYSAIIYVTETTAGDLKLRVTAQIETQNKSGASNTVVVKIYSELTSQEFLQIETTQENGANQLVQYLGGSSDNVENAMSQLTQWLKTQPGVASATNEGATSIEIKYSSGLYGGMIVSVEDDNGTISTRGGVLSKGDRKKSRRIPVDKQTRGTSYSYDTFKKVYAEGDCSDTTIIGNRNVLIYAPFEAAFAPANEGTDVRNILNTSGYEFSVTYVTDQAADINALSNLTSYGYVVLATHGSGGKAFATGEVVDTNTAAYQDSYKAMLKGEKLAIWKNMVIKKNGAVKTKKDIYAVRFPFISDLAGTFSRSVILNNSCESTKSDFLSNAFLGKGAKTYYGYSKIVSSGFCVTKAKEVTTKLAKDLKTTGEAFIAGIDPGSNHAEFQMRGANNIHYPETLINGDFECGNLFGWTRDGDGRVISRLASYNPSGGNYMGIISTGLGYTTSSGRIFQTFKVPNDKSTLTIKWDFFSEEFLEYIGSQYQDYFKIIIKDESGSEIEVLNRSIDGLASEFGAWYTSAEDNGPGNLISASPGVVFDIGGVFATGWQTFTYNISAYKGKKITLILESSDKGDSAYDTAILLDDCALQ